MPIRRCGCEEDHGPAGVLPLIRRATIWSMATWCEDAGRDREQRVVVGACGDDATARLAARALLLSGREVVFVGGGQDAEQLARTAEAEDAGSMVIDSTAEERAALERALVALGLPQVRVTGM